MGDPVSDPRAARLLAADPNEVGQLANMFHTVSNQAQTAAQELRGAQSDAHWTGQAADAFRRQLGKLPGDLDNVERSYGEVAQALSTYEDKLGPIRSQFQTLVGELTSAQGNLSTANGNLNAAKAYLHAATSAPHAKSTSPGVVKASDSVASAAGAVGRLQGDISGLERRGYQLLDEFDTARGHAIQAISTAASIAPSHSWLSGVLHAVGNFMAGTGHVLAGMAMQVVHSAESLPSDVVNVVEHPTDLRDWSKLGGDLGTVAGAVAVVAAVVICPLDAVGLDGVVAVVGTTGDIAGGVGVVSNFEKTGTDAALASEGEGSWETVAFDAVAAGSNFVHIPGLQDADDAKTLLDSKPLLTKSEGLENYAYARALGATHEEAYENLTDAQRMVLTKSAAKLSNPGRLQYMRSEAAKALETAEAADAKFYRLNAIDRSVRFVFKRANQSVSTAVVGQGGTTQTTRPKLGQTPRSGSKQTNPCVTTTAPGSR